jgi:hypothetical protein
MIPSITPPTDNLYKFISLFGLTILLFSVYNIGITFDASAKSKMGIEDVKVHLQQALYEKYKSTNDSLKTDKISTHFRPGKIRQMEQDLLQIEGFIANCQLDPKDQIELSGDISKISVALDNLSVKKRGYIVFGSLGFALMLFGFIKWHYKEQKLRDKMLAIEHAIKELEKLNLRYGKEDKSSIVESLVKMKNPETN